MNDYMFSQEVITTATATEQLGKYIKSKHISKKHISDVTGVSACTIYTAFGNARSRQLNADEFLIICRYLEVNPFDFLDDAQEGGKEGVDL